MDTWISRSVVEDHAALREMARGIQDLLGGCACSCGGAGCADCVGRQMDSLAARLRTHFRMEEESWSGLDRTRCSWTTLSWIDRLVDQHAGVTKALDEIHARIAEAQRQKSSVPEDLATDARRVLEQLMDHELSEARLFQRSVFEGWSRPD